MKIACLGWGSLIWDSRELPIERQWFTDGPHAPVEFARHSRDDRITLVITPNAAPVKVLWARMLLADLQTAKKALAEREGITGLHWSSRIGSWQKGEKEPIAILELSKWADAHGVDAVIWTALGPRLRDQDVAPTSDQVVEFLRNLTGTRYERAKQYVERAPRQIDTPYRRHIQATLGWVI